jgi:hypothetical protein
MSWLDYKFHPSSLSKIMTDSRTKDPLGETCLKHLAECWVEQRYKRRKDYSNKYMEKGKAVEEDAITLYSRVTKTFYLKNKEVVTNDFFTGTPDLFTGKSVREATDIKDIKCSWDIHTFYHNLLASTKKQYFWQLQGYMDLTGAKTASLVYVLINTPDKLVMDERKRLAWRMGVSDENVDQDYIDALEQLEKNMNFDDIPLEERYIEIAVPRDQEAIDKAHKRVNECRVFLEGLKHHGEPVTV